MQADRVVSSFAYSADGRVLACRDSGLLRGFVLVKHEQVSVRKRIQRKPRHGKAFFCIRSGKQKHMKARDGRCLLSTNSSGRLVTAASRTVALPLAPNSQHRESISLEGNGQGFGDGR